MSKEVNFNIYRYQILPRDRIEFSLFDDIKTIDELIQRKNQIFEAILLLLESQAFKYRQQPIKFQLKYSNENFLCFKLGIKRTTKIGNEDLEYTEQDDWKYIYVLFWNKSDKQFLLIQDKTQVFNNACIPHKQIINIINKALLEKNLIVKSEPLFDKSEFWKTIKDYPNKISCIKFKLITPNMANISKSLSKDLKNLSMSTNTSESSLEMKSTKESALH